ncbi:hypothetical protein I9W82_001866 [Candida metapsilosis]|uniref:Uncharacterized protein n=1 Tax=Candida metapsilosis TaxID=273372 RepID=A0A8H7ZJA2_9ASCO|nr:hypothetical protein I9W82_001866 [Candida metapsilosis]
MDPVTTLILTSVDWEDVLLKYILTNLNQHQALRLATLNSKFAKQVKSKLYRYIHVYMSEPLDNPEKNKPRFKFHKDINNFKTNKFTIISFDNFTAYLPKLDPNEPIYHLELFDIPIHFDDDIAIHLKKIEYFSVIAERYDVSWLTNYTEDPPSVFSYWTAACGNKNYSRVVIYDDDICDSRELENIMLSDFSRNNHVKCLKMTVRDGYRDLELLNQVSIFETGDIQELSLETFMKISSHLTGDLAHSFPKLKRLSLGVHEGISYIGKGPGDFQQLSHDNLQTLLISTDSGKENYPPAEMTSLFHNFPSATIHWWDTHFIEWPRRYAFDFLHMLSPTLPFAVMGLHWASNSAKFRKDPYWKQRWTIRAGKYMTKGDRGRDLEVLLKRVYSSKELESIKMSNMEEELHSWR